jgi:hypothetical protein
MAVTQKSNIKGKKSDVGQLQATYFVNICFHIFVLRNPVIGIDKNYGLNTTQSLIVKLTKILSLHFSSFVVFISK